MDQFTMAEFAKNSENKEGTDFTPTVQETGIEQGSLIVSKLYNTMLGEITKYLRSIDAELVNVLDEAGIAPSTLSEHQLYTAIKKIIEQSHGRNVGDVYFSYSSSASDNVGGLPLFTGELISNADNVYPQFYTWLSTHPEVCTTEASWQSAISVYGECPKYVLNTQNRTVRLPLLKNYLKMANITNGIEQAGAGVPNITGNFYGEGDFTFNNYHMSGAFKEGPSVQRRDPAHADVHTYPSIAFDASRCSDVYGNSDTITPAHFTLYPWVCVYNEAIPASTAQAAQFQQALTSKADTDLSNCTKPHIVSTYINGTSWYRVWSDGWCEQGGYATSIYNTQVINLLKAYNNTNYQIYCTQYQGSSYGTASAIQPYNKTSNSFQVVATQVGTYGFWKAEGYIS